MMLIDLQIQTNLKFDYSHLFLLKVINVAPEITGIARIKENLAAFLEIFQVLVQ